MPQLKKTQTISEARVDFSKNLDKNGIIPITRDGKFSAVLLSIGALNEATAKRLFDLLEQNNIVGIENIRQKALK